MTDNGYDNRMLLLTAYKRLTQTYWHFENKLANNGFYDRADKIKKLRVIAGSNRERVGMGQDMDFKGDIDEEYHTAQNDIYIALLKIYKFNKEIK